MKVLLLLVLMCFVCQSLARRNYVIRSYDGTFVKYENAYGSTGCGSFTLRRNGMMCPGKGYCGWYITHTQGGQGNPCPALGMRSPCKIIPGNPRAYYPGCCPRFWCPRHKSS